MLNWKGNKIYKLHAPQTKWNKCYIFSCFINTPFECGDINLVFLKFLWYYNMIYYSGVKKENCIFWKILAHSTTYKYIIHT